jgi:epoxide hydrolase-like predicted phosphatase
MSIRAIIWDLGGVLLRTEDRAPRREAAARLGLTYEQLEDLVFNGDLGTRAQLGEMTDLELWEGVRQALNLPREELPWLREAFFGGDRLDGDLVNFVRSLRPRYQTGLISNAWNDLRDFMARRLKIMDAFDHLVVSGEEGVMKPDPRIYRLSLQGLGVEAHEAVFIDDNLRNVEGARAVGMHAVRFLDPEQARRELQELLDPFK